MIRLGLLALNGYGCGVVDILIRSVYNIGWCIVGKQSTWGEGMLALDLHQMGAARTFSTLRLPNLPYLRLDDLLG